MRNRENGFAIFPCDDFAALYVPRQFSCEYTSSLYPVAQEPDQVGWVVEEEVRAEVMLTMCTCMQAPVCARGSWGGAGVHDRHAGSSGTSPVAIIDTASKFKTLHFTTSRLNMFQRNNQPQHVFDATIMHLLRTNVDQHRWA